jgi:hypothetical protein
MTSNNGMKHTMRTTLDLDFDILTALKERAAFESSSLGKVASKLIKQALLAKPESQDSRLQPKERNGIQLIQRTHPPKDPITMARIQAIADEEGI